MRKLISALLLLAATSASAKPYFRPLDLANPHVIAGAYLDPAEIGRSEAGTAIAVFTHATEDGCAVPKVVCMDWTPLAIGGVASSGRVRLAVGPVFNLAPVIKSLALKGLRAATAEESFGNLKSSLGSVPLNGPDVTVSIGPAWVLAPQERWKGYLRFFLGGELKFGKGR